MQSTNRFKRQVAKVLLSAALIIIMSVLMTSVSFADPPAWNSWDYNLLGPLNSTSNVPDEEGEETLTMVILGSGSFVDFEDDSEDSINGGGSYTIYNEAGDAVGSGDWTAQKPFEFKAYSPGNSPGQGGRLELFGTFTGEGEGALNGTYAMVIQCSMWTDPEEELPPGYPWDADFVHAGPYTEDVFGAVMFNLNPN